MDDIELLIAGRFNEAIEAFATRVRTEPNKIAWIDGLANSYMGSERFAEAIPLLERVHDYQKLSNPDAPGQQLSIAIAYWCLEVRQGAIERTRQLCDGILNRSINMAPDQAGGATFGLILHYMAVTAGDEAGLSYALDYLRKLDVKYDRNPKLFLFPKQSVKQILGELCFEDALEGATGERNLAAARNVADNRRLAKAELSIALFHDGANKRAHGDEAGCTERMNQVYELGYESGTFQWYLARHEVKSI